MLSKHKITNMQIIAASESEEKRIEIMKKNYKNLEI